MAGYGANDTQKIPLSPKPLPENNMLQMDRLSNTVPLVRQRVDPRYNTIVFGQIIGSWVNLKS